MGLLSGALGGLGGAAQDISQGWIKNEQALDLEKERSQIALDREAAVLALRDSYQQNVDARAKQQRADDYNQVVNAADADMASAAMAGLGEAGKGVHLSPEDVQSLRDNPQAVEAYRNAGATGLLNSTPLQIAIARRDAALATGNNDLAANFQNDAATAKSDARYQDALDKITRDEIRQAARDKVSDEDQKADNARADKQLESTLAINRVMMEIHNATLLDAEEKKAAERMLNDLNATFVAAQQMPDGENKSAILADLEIKFASLGRVVTAPKEMDEVTEKTTSIDDNGSAIERTVKSRIPTSSNVVINGLPKGSVFVREKNGKKIYRAPNGKEYIED